MIAATRPAWMLAGVLLVASCFAYAQPPAQRLRLHGSNTIGQKLAPALVQTWAAERGYATQVGSSRPEETEIVLTAADTRLVVEIHAHGTGTGLADLASGEADIWMASRPVTATEVAAHRALGTLDGPAHEHIVALDGLAVVVHPASPVDELTVDEVRAVFAGSIADWSALGGRPGRIRLHARDDKSGTYDSFRSMVLRDVPLSASARRYESTSALAEAVAADPHAIGFVGLAGRNGAKALRIATTGVRALAPTRQTVSTEDYVLSRRLYFYATADAPALATDFIEFVLSDAGQAVVEATGFVPQAISAFDVTALDVEPREDVGGEYAELTRDAQRLSLNLRFGSGISFLDNKALRDIDRLVAWMERPSHRRLELLLFGFSDGNEINPYQSVSLSNERADYVALQLVQRGVPPGKVRGLGHVARVADDSTVTGRAHNRRVEVWVRERESPSARASASRRGAARPASP